ncbi:MAG: pseudouridine synthase [Chloroflexi bacterium HGW-Chloroflexi-8]|jgi:23S rRNA pseudouridine2605 synthase|nr:MAG: pseudouridine synthase [Chloroflexi bacterium HGW-Chloroflexi-8]
MVEERLQKILAKSGYGSRRSNEELIITGRVKVNGVIATLGMKADLNKDEISVDSQVITKPDQIVYIALNKPRGVLSDQAAGDPRRNIRDLIDLPGHLFTVGRLDMDSEGLILLTNDGDLTNKLTHPRYGHEKEYMVLVASRPDDDQLDIWRRGVVLEDGFKTAPAKVSVSKFQGKGAWLNVTMQEGHKRQIREICKAIGLGVVKLIRVRISVINLGNLKSGEWRYLNDEEVKNLKNSASEKFSSPRKGSKYNKSTKTIRTPRSVNTPTNSKSEGRKGSSTSAPFGEKRSTLRPNSKSKPRQRS